MDGQLTIWDTMEPPNHPVLAHTRQYGDEMLTYSDKDGRWHGECETGPFSYCRQLVEYWIDEEANDERG